MEETRREYLVKIIDEVLKFGADGKQIVLMLEHKGVVFE